MVAIVAIVASVYVLLYTLARVTRGSLTGGVKRFLQLGLWTLTTAQVRRLFLVKHSAVVQRTPSPTQVVSQASSVQSSSLPGFVKGVYRAVLALQFAGILLPPACTGA